MRVLVTGGAGFIGSHAAEFFTQQGDEVSVLDNLSRKGSRHNWNHLANLKNISLTKGDILDRRVLLRLVGNADVIIHTAAQTAVTTSILKPRHDFETNVVGTFNILEAARTSERKTVIFCSTNKVYGDSLNKQRIYEGKSRYALPRKRESGVPEIWPIDLSLHTPYGCSKLAADLYMQEYAYLYGVKIGVFRMSCIYGERQFGIEDQGWVAWFAIATLLRKPITIYGDGKQVRDILYISDLLDAYQKFIESDLDNGVFNIGGGPKNTVSLLELLDLLEELTGLRSKIQFRGWRRGDQKIYFSDIGKLHRALDWTPKTPPKQGVKKLLGWVDRNAQMLDHLNQL